ncbi:proton-transporting V-type ATPase complex assembly regulator TMEM9-like [Achroia grisella]|uniref:proton-transporting V-type ATPase complex assembly regulator TMEM9-like n=1 Tax=Achroia grisella TaxID=688607 RepID=UPI0027D31390|nr:proton-transporting V-type ATPase complex assembly regulator TMEM9-like [Achroia grisella]
MMKVFILFLHFTYVLSQSYEDRRCRCVCPSPAAVLNSTLSTDRKLFIANVHPSKCNCDGVILPRVGDEVKGHEQEFCPRCECKYETRNTTVIMVVVIMVLWLLMLLSVYMGFLMCLDPLIKKKKAKYHREQILSDEACNLLVHGDDAED